MDNAFQWVPFYEALADSLLTYSDKREELFEVMKKISSEQPLMQYLNFEREDWWGPRKHQIDPFSVIGVINRGVSDQNRTMLATVLADTFEISLPAPTQFAGIPVLDNRKSFFAGVDAIWNLFIASIKSVQTNTFSDDFKVAFEEAIAIKDNGLASITMGLYWIRPNTFMPLDGNSRAFVSSQYGVEAPNVPCSGDDYVKFHTALKTKILQRSPTMTLPEVSYTAWAQKPTVIDEQKQRAAFKQWYANNVGTANSVNTISSALGKAKLKNGRAIFAITDFEELDTAIKNNGLDEYFQSRGGDYSKMDAVFDIDKTAQRDDLKSGVKYYLSFLKSLNQVAEHRQKYLTITHEEAKIIDIDFSDKTLLDKLHQRLKDWTYGNNLEFKNIYNVYENGTPNFTSNDQKIEYLQLLRQMRTVCGGQQIPYTHIYNALTSDQRGVEARKKYSYLNGWIGLNRPLDGKGNNSAFNHIVETHRDYIFKGNKNEEKGTRMAEDVFPKISLNKNIILYGPPGTGKTYSSIQYAVAIIENKPLPAIKAEDYDAVFARYLKYKDDGLVAFTTFHQSFGYEEFIEGIRPVVSSEENAETGREIEYEIRDGIFKTFCDKAGAPIADGASVDLGIGKNPTVWKVSLEGTGDNPTRSECMENNHIRIGWDRYGENISDSTDYDGGKAVLNAFYNRMQLGDIVMSCYSSKTIDAVGVITGEPEWHDEYPHYKRLRNVKWLAKGINEDIVDLNAGKSMTLSSIYKLSVSVSDALQILRNVNAEIFTQEVKISNRVFIIDEINRGNISKIFGELITLIEPSKRIGAKEQLRAMLPYSGKNFGVPDNVYIIGTMNTADRSIALIDTALRRRFSFIEIQPESATLNNIFVGGINIANLLDILNKRIAVLLDRDHTVGHSYLIPLKTEPTVDNLADIFEKKIMPLLQEYFYDDYGKIQLVLGDNQKSNNSMQFIIKKTDSAKFFGNADVDLQDYYEINSAAFKNIDAYAFIQ